MVDEWFQTENSVVLRPRLSNILKLAALKLFIGFICLVLIILLLHLLGILSTIADSFTEFGLHVSSSQALKYLIIGVSIATILAFVVAFFQAKTCKYEFFSDKIVVSKPLAVLLNYSADISLDNVVAVNYSSTSILDKLFNIGTIELQLSGTEQKKETLPFVQNAPQIATWIKGLLDNYNAKKQAAMSERERIESIISEY